MRARLKSEPQDVWQHDDEARIPAWVYACTEWRDGELCLVRGADKQRIEVGDWLIRDLDGAPTWSTDEDFQREYEVVGG
jgi:hypothetical protein